MISIIAVLYLDDGHGFGIGILFKLTGITVLYLVYWIVQLIVWYIVK